MLEKKNPGEKRINKTLHARVDGVVQGVGFRYSTLHQARRLGLCGYVRNLWNGMVEIVAEGQQEKLQQFERWLRRGPPGAIVRRVESHYTPWKGVYRSFTIEF